MRSCCLSAACLQVSRRSRQSGGSRRSSSTISTRPTPNATATSRRTQATISSGSGLLRTVVCHRSIIRRSFVPQSVCSLVFRLSFCRWSFTNESNRFYVKQVLSHGGRISAIPTQVDIALPPCFVFVFAHCARYCPSPMGLPTYTGASSFPVVVVVVVVVVIVVIVIF